MRKTLFAFIIPILTIAQNKEKSDSIKTQEIQSINIKSKKKFVEYLADRIIYNFENQPLLSSGSLIDGLKKIPGIIASESVDVMYQGKTLDFYMDGKPMKISGSNLIAFLEGFPANSIEKIEIITNPGAEFPATSNNAILNIISYKKAKNYETLTYSGNYGFSTYDKYRNKGNHSIFFASKYKNVNWKINTGVSYKEKIIYNEFSDLYAINYDKFSLYHFIKPGLTYHFKNAKLLFDYDLMMTNTNNTIKEYLNKNTNTNNQTIRNEISGTYQQFFNDNNRNKLEIQFIYTDFNNKFKQITPDIQNKTFNNNLTWNINYNKSLKIFNKSKISIGTRYDIENINIQNNTNSSFTFKKNTFATYTEFNTSVEHIDFILGLRAENYHHKGVFSGQDIIYNNLKVFPNTSIKYDIINSVSIIANYNKKIKFPSVSALNPNNTIFQSKNISYYGNPNLQPTSSNNYSLKFSAFDYATLSFDINKVKNDIIFLATRNGNNIQYQYQNASNLKVQTFSISFPLPLMLFTKGFNELMKFNFDIDKINVFYFYVDYQKYKSETIGKQKGIWSFFTSSQIILPKDITFQAIYKITGTGNYRYLLIDQPFQNSLSFNISKKFINNKLFVSVYGNDILNTNRTIARTLPLMNGIFINQKTDSRTFGISLTYKILTSKNNEKTTEQPNKIPTTETKTDIEM